MPNASHMQEHADCASAMGNCKAAEVSERIKARKFKKSPRADGIPAGIFEKIYTNLQI